MKKGIRKPKLRLPTAKPRVGIYYFMSLDVKDKTISIDPTNLALVRMVHISEFKDSFSYVVVNIKQPWLECIFRQEIYHGTEPTFYLATAGEVVKVKSEAKEFYKAEVDKVIGNF
jgi:hypothetical protein